LLFFFVCLLLCVYSRVDDHFPIRVFETLAIIYLTTSNCNTEYKMDFQSAMETFAEAWVAANTKGGSLSDVGCSQVSHLLTWMKFKQFNINTEMFALRFDPVGCIYYLAD